MLNIEISAVVYIRVSTEDQRKSGLGLEAQEFACRAVCRSLGLEVLSVFSESHSGKKAPLERPVFKAAHDAALANDAKLVIAKLDRLSRNFGATVAYIETYSKPELLIAENPYMTTMELRLRAVFAAEERDMISKRTKAALAAKKARGYHFGVDSARVRKEKALEANRPSLLRAVELRQNGFTLADVAEVLNSEGFCNSVGNKWTGTLLAHHLRNTVIYAEE